MVEDPYQVLGVERGVDPAALRKAYARMIREYRPDRAPVEFARVHAAYERIQAILAGAPLPERMPEPMPEPESEPMPIRIRALYEARRYDELVAMLAEPRLIEDVFHDARVACAVLPAVAALAWRTPVALGLGERLRSLPPALGLDALVTDLENELVLASRFHSLRARGLLVPPPFDVPVPLIDLFADGAHGTLEALRPIVDEHVHLRDFCDRLAHHDRWAAAWLMERLRRDSKVWGPRALEPLPPATRAAFEQRMREIVVPGRAGRLLLYSAMIVPAVIISGVVLVKTGNHWSLAGGALVIGAERLHNDWLNRTYATLVRPLLFLAVGDLGVQSDCIGAWIPMQKHRRKSHHLGPYENRIRDDTGLALFAAIATVVREDAQGT